MSEKKKAVESVDKIINRYKESLIKNSGLTKTETTVLVSEKFEKTIQLFGLTENDYLENM
jgi:hypothetical protein